MDGVMCGGAVVVGITVVGRVVVVGAREVVGRVVVCGYVVVGCDVGNRAQVTGSYGPGLHLQTQSFGQLAVSGNGSPLPLQSRVLEQRGDEQTKWEPSENISSPVALPIQFAVSAS